MPFQINLTVFQLQHQLIELKCLANQIKEQWGGKYFNPVKDFFVVILGGR